jgi:glycosyltransferase involved in cell wall biosynthesis
VKKPTIAFALIVKGTDDEAPLLEQCLNSLDGHVDAVYLGINYPKGKKISKKIMHVAKRHKAVIHTFEWKDDFAGARNFIFSQIPKKYDFIGWCDTDDTLDGVDKLRDVLDSVPKYADGILMKYDYEHDDQGNVTVTHWVVRVVRNNGTFQWKSSFADKGITVHETLSEKRRVAKVMNEEVKVIHHADNERKTRSLNRNIELLERMYDKNNKDPDPRILYYLATHYFGVSRFAEAENLFKQYVELSGWPEERASAFVYMGQLADFNGDPMLARQCYLYAIGENPSDPDSYVELGELEFKQGLYEKSVRWLEMAVDKKPNFSAMVMRPMDNTFRAYMLLAQSHVNMGGKHLEIALPWAEKALKLRPNDQEANDALDLIQNLIRIRNLTDGAVRLVKQLERDNRMDNIPLLLDLLPAELQDSPAILKIRNHYTEPEIWGKKSIAMYVGQGPLGLWGPWSLEEGVGGSEEAVIRLSKELVKHGWEVTVYGTPGDRAGAYDGVVYKNYWEINLQDTFDVFIAWRSPWFFDAKINARKKYLWLHDKMEVEEFTPERIANLDKVILLSKYHRDCYPMIPEEKVLYSANGIDPEEFTQHDQEPRDEHRMIYTSSHVRGLQLLLDCWPEIKKQVPDATLDIYYGWESFEAIHRGNPERMAWKDKITRQIEESDGVTDHGRVGHDVIAKEMSKSDVWPYPCPFPEIYCITAVKAQAAGAIPVSSNFAALDETVQYGGKMLMKDFGDKEAKQFTKLLVEWLTKPQEEKDKARAEMKKWARENCSWAKVAEGWINEFNKN